MIFSFSARAAAKTVATAMVATTAIMAFHGLTAVYAQSETPSEIDQRLLACADISDTVERIACFDGVVTGLKQDTESSAVPAAPTPAESLAEAAAPIAAGAAATSIPSAPAEETAAESSSLSPPAEPKDVGTAEAPANSASEDFGLEDQLAQAEKEEKKQQEKAIEAGSINATIVGSAKSGLNHFVVELDNGQVWEETDGSRRSGLPRVGLPVEVYKGRFGGYRMKIGKDNRVAWVRRIK